MKLTRRRAAELLAYCDSELTRTDLHEEKRAFFEGKAGFYRRLLAGSCSRCGRTLKTKESLARGIGPECLNNVEAKAS